MISAVILTKNEEKNIVDCVESVLFCDEIIIIDDNSSDMTAELVKNLSKMHTKIELFERKLGIDFSAQRKYGIDKTKNNWILFVDADERITKELAEEIKENVSEELDVGGFFDT